MKKTLVLALIPVFLVVYQAGRHYLSRNESREPASIDLSHLDGEEFVTAARVRMLEGLEATAQDGQHLISMGHFQDDGGSMCKNYPNVQYVWVADDGVVNGEPIEMKISGECNASVDTERLSSLEVPYRKILLEKAGDLTMKIFDKNKTEVQFSNVGDEWPRAWSLKSARIIGENKEIQVTASEIFGFRGRPVQIRWPN